MESNDIIKALEECIELRFDDTEYVTVRLDTLTNTLDLINCLQADYDRLQKSYLRNQEIFAEQSLENERLKAEIERLQKEVNLVSIQFQDIQERQEESQAEIDKLNAENMLTMSKRNAFRTSFYDVLEQLKTAKSEAYKECLAKVKNYIKTHCNPYGKPDFDYDTSIKILNFIDNLLKEMTGE